MQLQILPFKLKNFNRKWQIYKLKFQIYKCELQMYMHKWQITILHLIMMSDRDSFVFYPPRQNVHKQFFEPQGRFKSRFSRPNIWASEISRFREIYGPKKLRCLADFKTFLKFSFLFKLSLFCPKQYSKEFFVIISYLSCRDAPPWVTWLRTL